jgi:uroporphyrinogen-III synthase
VRPRVLVTRPEPGASRTAARLEVAGFDTTVLPLTRIAPLDFIMPDGEFDGVIVTSAQALKGVDAGRLLTIPIFAVGEMTARSARSAGFETIITAGGSVDSISELVLNGARPAARLLYLCGKVRRPDLETALGDAGLQLVAVETYDAIPVDYSHPELIARLGDASFDAVALMSAQAAKLFSALAEDTGFAPLFTQSVVACFSPRIANSLSQYGAWRVSVTEEASEDALLVLLSKLFPEVRPAG